MITDKILTDETYVVFDLETTGLYPNSGDSIIEIGAVKCCNGEIIDRYDELINPGVKLDSKIVEITCITDEMLSGKRDEMRGIISFLEWAKDLPLVAHNAKFDISFVEAALKKYDLGPLNNIVIDTLGISRYLESGERYHNLATLVKRYDIPWDEDKHHRADYDSEGTALIFYKMLKKLQLNEIITMNDLSKYPYMVIRKGATVSNSVEYPRQLIKKKRSEF